MALLLILLNAAATAALAMSEKPTAELHSAELLLQPETAGLPSFVSYCPF